jgi:hypothetical protein
VRRLSSVLLTIEAIVLVFPTFLGGLFLLGTSGLAWRGVWDGSGSRVVAAAGLLLHRAHGARCDNSFAGVDSHYRNAFVIFAECP